MTLGGELLVASLPGGEVTINLIKSPRHVYSPNSEASVSNDGKIPGFCKFLFLSSVLKFDNEMSEVKTKITIAQLLFMQSQNLLSKTRTTLFITR